MGAAMIAFGDWRLPVQFDGALSEHKHCRQAASLFDTGHMGIFHFRGDQAAAGLSRVCTQNPHKLRVGRCRYGFLLDEQGGILDDTILMRLAEDEFLLVVNAGTAAGDEEWIRAQVPGLALVNLQNRGWSKLDLQGPLSWEVLHETAGLRLVDLPYFGVRRCNCLGYDVVISRAGYTGELGYELMGPHEAMVEIFAALLQDARVKPAGLGARDSLRLEMCYPLYGHELSQARNPVEARLDSFIEYSHDFVGARALAEKKREGAAMQLIAFRARTRRRANAGDRFVLGGKQVGAVSSGAFLPSLGVSGGMGYIASSCSDSVGGLTVETARGALAVDIQEKPLYREGTCRMKVN